MHVENEELKSTKKQSKFKKWLSGKSKKSIILGSIFVIVIPVAAGVVAGIVINKFFIGKTVNYDINETELQTDTEKVMSKYQYCLDNDIAFEEKMKPYEMVAASYSLFESYENSKSVSIGLGTAAVVSQSIRNYSLKVGNSYFEESISKSNLVGVAARTYMDENKNINYYEGTATGETTANWPDFHYEYTCDEFSDVFGRTPETSCVYLINKKTTLSGEVINNDSTYTINLKMHPINAVINYVKQMQNISHLKDKPAFDYVELSFVCDKNLLLKTCDIHESYYAKTTSGVGADIEERMQVTYEVGGDYKIPTLTETVNYGGSK